MTNQVPSLVVFGAGRMGVRVAGLAPDYGYQVQGMISRRQPDGIGGIPWYSRCDDLSQTPDVVIDFSLPAGIEVVAAWCGARGVPLLSGTTGLEKAQHDALLDASKRCPVLHAANFSRAMNVLFSLVADAAALLPEKRAIQILDIHHAGKKDAPSGTALALAEAAGDEQATIESVREGEHVGEHRVAFQLADERLELKHEAMDRDLFVHGALDAAGWLRQQPPGLYRASDWVRSMHQGVSESRPDSST